MLKLIFFVFFISSANTQNLLGNVIDSTVAGSALGASGNAVNPLTGAVAPEVASGSVAPQAITGLGTPGTAAGTGTAPAIGLSGPAGGLGTPGTAVGPGIAGTAPGTSIAGTAGGLPGTYGPSGINTNYVNTPGFAGVVPIYSNTINPYPSANVPGTAPVYPSSDSHPTAILQKPQAELPEEFLKKS